MIAPTTVGSPPGPQSLDPSDRDFLFSKYLAHPEEEIGGRLGFAVNKAGLREVSYLNSGVSWIEFNYEINMNEFLAEIVVGSPRCIDGLRCGESLDRAWYTVVGITPIFAGDRYGRASQRS